MAGPVRHQAIIWTNVGMLLNGTFQWNINQNPYNFIKKNAFENVVCKMSAVLFPPQCVNFCFMF